MTALETTKLSSVIDSTLGLRCRSFHFHHP